MKTQRFACCAIFCAASALAGCASLNGGGSSDVLKQIDANFAGCDRHITFQAGLGMVAPSAQVSGSVDCKGVAAGAAPPVAMREN